MSEKSDEKITVDAGNVRDGGEKKIVTARVLAVRLQVFRQ